MANSAQMNPMDTENARAAAENALQFRVDLQHLGWQLFLVFMLGSWTSAFWTLREGKKPAICEVVSSSLVSGMFSVAIVALLSDYQISAGKLIFVSIMCGFAGDVIIRAVTKAFVSALKRFITALSVAAGNDQNDRK